jgi:2-amino-4-hydroxy-6-hydroxymethyldihydropteridine diphosphokinase
MPLASIALGGNQGDVERNITGALAALQRVRGLRLVATSSIRVTRPVGEHAGGPFHNAAATLDATLAPLDLLHVLQDLERKAGRRSADRWSPRPLDLDLVFYGDSVIEHPRLSVPHPACWYRRFVLDPLAEIAADLRHPVKGLTVDDLRRRLLPRPLKLALAGSTPAARRALIADLTSAAREAAIAEWSAAESADREAAAAEPAIIAWLGPSPDPPAGTREAVSFESLPPVPRLDASRSADPRRFLQDVLTSALG